MTTTDTPQPNATAALLVDLVTNTLDPGYAAAKRSGPPSRRRHRLDQVLLAIGCMLVGFTLVVAYINTHRAAPQAATVHTDLVNRVRSAQASADKLQASAQRLSTTINGLRDQALGGSSALRAQLQVEQLQAGTVAVDGPGLLVQLANPPAPTATAAGGRPGTTPLAQSQVLTDRDVRSVVNELWSDGAEAISVNDIRLTATSAIRFAGEAVLVDFEPINPPYAIRAIGNADQLDTGFAASGVASRYTTLAAVQGIGFSFSERTSLHLPASTVSGPNYAAPPGSAAAGPDTSPGARSGASSDTSSDTSSGASPPPGATK